MCMYIYIFFFRIISLCSNPAGGSFVCSASVHRSRSASGSSDILQGFIGKVGKLSYWDLRTMKMIVSSDLFGQLTDQ